MVMLAEKIDKKSLLETHQSKYQNLEEQFFLARSRLTRLARRYGVSADAVDDVVQETFLYAWRHLDQLYTLDVFDKWLDGICRNLCMRWRRAYSINALRETSMSSQDEEKELADPSQTDLLEALECQELQILLDRALGYLPETAREVLQLCYLEEMPQREVASQLGLSVNALEVRLHRARRRFHTVLETELRADANAFGLVMNEKALHWYQTRLWCGLCGKRRLRGCFEAMADEKINMRLCCPDCSRDGTNLLCTLGKIQIINKRSFLQALRQVGSEIYHQHHSMVYDICPYCHAHGQIHPLAYGEIPETVLRCPPHLLKCHLCGAMSGHAIADYVRIFDETVQDFSVRHPRTILTTQDTLLYDGQSAIRYSLVDVLSKECLTVTVHSRTLQVLTVS